MSDTNHLNADEGVPVSVKIRERLKQAGQRFNANDNIAGFIEPGELAALLDEVETKMQGVLDSLVIDPSSDHNTQDTARRIAKMYVSEVFRGRYNATPEVTEFPNAARLNELMIVGPITVRSACSHHFCPVIGKLWWGSCPMKTPMSSGCRSTRGWPTGSWAVRRFRKKPSGSWRTSSWRRRGPTASRW